MILFHIFVMFLNPECLCIPVRQSQVRVGLPTTPNSVTTPTRRDSYSPPVPDTPSRDVVLEPEPRGAEFDVGHWSITASASNFLAISPQYFKNVLFEYMMGRQTRVSDNIPSLFQSIFSVSTLCFFLAHSCFSSSPSLSCPFSFLPSLPPSSFSLCSN